MAKRFTIQVGDRTAVAELLEDQAPGVSAKFWESLPLDSFSIHAKFAGGEMIVMLPFFADSEKEILDVQPGDIAYFPAAQTACIFYGDVTPFGYVTVFARVVEGLPELQAAGAALLEKISLPVKFAPVGGAPAARPGPGTGLVGEIDAFIQKVWAREPEDIKKLRGTPLPPSGRWSGTFFCDLTLLWSCQTLATFRTRALAGDDPKALVGVTAAQLKELAVWIAHWHLDDTVALLRRVADGLPSEVTTGQDLARVIERLLVAMNRMNTWIDGYLPWTQLDTMLPPMGPDQAPGHSPR